MVLKIVSWSRWRSNWLLKLATPESLVYRASPRLGGRTLEDDMGGGTSRVCDTMALKEMLRVAVYDLYAEVWKIIKTYEGGYTIVYICIVYMPDGKCVQF